MINVLKPQGEMIMIKAQKIYDFNKNLSNDILFKEWNSFIQNTVLSNANGLLCIMDVNNVINVSKSIENPLQMINGDIPGIFIVFFNGIKKFEGNIHFCNESHCFWLNENCTIMKAKGNQEIHDIHYSDLLIDDIAPFLNWNGQLLLVNIKDQCVQRCFPIVQNVGQTRMLLLDEISKFVIEYTQDRKGRQCYALNKIYRIQKLKLYIIENEYNKQ